MSKETKSEKDGSDRSPHGMVCMWCGTWVGMALRAWVAGVG